MMGNIPTHRINFQLCGMYTNHDVEVLNYQAPLAILYYRNLNSLPFCLLGVSTQVLKFNRMCLQVFHGDP